MTIKAALCAVALLQSSVAFAAAPPVLLWPPPRPAPGETTPARIAEILIAEGIAAERARLAPDAPVLADDMALTQIARARCDEMADGAPFSHQDDSGAYPAEDRVRAAFGPYGAIGENIMKETGLSHFDPAAFARSAVAGWMASPGHRENILSPDFRSSGIGVTVKDGAVFAAQVFFGPPARRARPLQPSGG